ncbi:MAG: hypothetical protein F6K55_19950 [Moorea sp. SIO4A3]|nr:hypothetical protein [Moorena sp. SIO4A3]
MATRSRSTKQPSTCNNLGLWPRDRVQPNNLQPVTTLAFGHAIAFNLQPVTTLAFGHAIAFNLQPNNLQPATFNQTTFNL